MFGINKIARKIVDDLMFRSREWAQAAGESRNNSADTAKAKAIAIILEIVAKAIAEAADIDISPIP